MALGQKGEHRDVLAVIRKAGFLRPDRRRGGGRGKPPRLDRTEPHHIEAVVDRVVVREGVRNRLAESIRLAIRHGDGLVLAACDTRVRAATAFGTIAVQHAVRLPALQDQLRRTGAPEASVLAVPTAPARPAKGWVSARSSIPSSSCPTRSLSPANGAVTALARLARSTPQGPGRNSKGFSNRRASVGMSPWTKWNLKSEDLAPRRWREVPRRARALGTGIRGQRRRPGAATVGIFPRASPLYRVRRRLACGRKPAQCASPVRQSTRSPPFRCPGAGVLCGVGSSLPMPRRSRNRWSPRSARGWSSSTGWGWITSRSIGPPTHSAAASCNGCGWPRDSVRDWSAFATCSTSRRSACTRATAGGSSRRSAIFRPEATRWSSSNTTRPSIARPTGWWTSAPVRAATAGELPPRARRSEVSRAPQSLTGRYLSGKSRSTYPRGGTSPRPRCSPSRAPQPITSRT